MTDSVITFEIIRFWFLRGVSLIYTLAFFNIINQFHGLLGSKGLLPIQQFVNRISFKRSPSIFYFYNSDLFIKALAYAGLAISLFALSGLSDHYGWAIFICTWLSLWLLYQSFVNVGQDFYSFGWESMLLETGFAILFFGPMNTYCHPINIWLVRWILFRTMFGAGMIKLRGDQCWWDLTCLHYHYQTQPIPNPISWYLHKLPGLFHKFCVLLTHFIELIIPWLLFIPGTPCALAGLIIILFQASLMISGNLCWLNLLTIVYCIPCFSDSYLPNTFLLDLPIQTSIQPIHLIAIIAYTLFVLYYSIPIITNLLSSRQRMNTCSAPYHLIGSYGAFGSITKERYEIIISGTSDNPTNADTIWKEYEFIGKPGNIFRRPAFIAPYHYRLDWLMWFAAMGPHYYYPWLQTLISKLLKNERCVTKLLKENPFERQAPQAVKMDLYLYQFSGKGKKEWWNRKYMGVYIPPKTLR